MKSFDDWNWSWQGITGIVLMIVGIGFYLLERADIGSALVIISIILTTWGLLKGWNTRDFWK